MIKQLRSRTVSIGEVNARKKNNMAGDNNGNNEKQYTNNDLMAILLGNQQTLATITTDVAKIQTDLSSVKLRQNELISQVDDVDARLESVERDVNEGDDCIKNRLDITMKALRRTQISCINSEYQSMLYNVIVYNMKVTGTREKQADSINNAYYVLENCFNLPNARSTIPLSTAHRLPSTKGRQPLIFKLSKLSDKQILWDNIKQVKVFNNSRPDEEKLSIQMVQLPRKLAHDKSSLQNGYDKAREDELSPKWRFLKKSGQYCYVVNNVYYKPTVDYFLHEFVSKKTTNSN